MNGFRAEIEHLERPLIGSRIVMLAPLWIVDPPAFPLISIIRLGVPFDGRPVFGSSVPNAVCDLSMRFQGWPLPPQPAGGKDPRAANSRLIRANGRRGAASKA